MPTQPALIANHLDTEAPPYGLLMVHEGRVTTFSPPLADVTGAFCDDGRGGLIAAARSQGGGAGYINARGDWLAAPDLDDARSFGAGTLARYCEDGLWGYMGLDGKPAIAPRWSLAAEFQHGLAAVLTAADTWRYIDQCGDFAFAGEFVIAGPFSAKGLAAASPSPGERFGYLNRQGSWIVEPCFASGNVPHMGNGVVRANADTYLTRDGALDVGAGICWGADFNEHGFALVLTLSDGPTLDREGEPMPGWGILRTDGQFAMAPDIMEPFPLDPRNGTFLAPEPNTPLAVFVSYDDNLLMLDRDARIAFRLRIEQGSDGQYTALYDDQARLLWTSPVSGTLKRPTRFFFPDDAWFYDELDPAGQLADAARAMLLETEQKLQQVARDPHFDIDACARDDAAEHRRAHDDYDQPHDSDDDDEGGNDDMNDDAMRIAKFVRTRRRIAHFHIDKQVAGLYRCLGWLRNEHLYEVHEHLEQTLCEQFGDSQGYPDFAGRPARLFHRGWPFQLNVPVTGDAAVAPEAKRLWLALSASGNRDDGGEVGNVWLTCAPDIDTFKLALKARAEKSPRRTT